MDKQFDEFSKSLAEGISRREALRKFGIGLVGILLASVGLTSMASANRTPCASSADCKNNHNRINSVGARQGHIHCHCKMPNYGCSTLDCLSHCVHRCTGGF